MFNEIMDKVSKTHPLVHCITNYVTVNDVANMILAVNGSPIMADEILEVEQITTITHALVINIGTLNQSKVESMIKAGKKANALGHPVILDPVGAGASSYRSEAVKRLLEEVKFSVIKGNISEIKCIAQKDGRTDGVDASKEDELNESNQDEVVTFAKSLSAKTGAVIAITGATDIVCDANTAYFVKNGHPLMSRITGTGCMLAGVIAVYVASCPEEKLKATLCAITMMGLAGEIAYDKQNGTSSFRMHLIDAMSKMNTNLMEGGMKIDIQ